MHVKYNQEAQHTKSDIRKKSRHVSTSSFHQLVRHTNIMINITQCIHMLK